MEERGRCCGEWAAGYLDLVVELGIGEDIKAGAESAALGIVRGIDETGNAGLNDGAGAHGAGLEGDVESGAGEAIVVEETRGFADDDDFGVRGGVIVANGAIAGARQDFILVNKESPDGDLPGLGGSLRFGERELHEVEIV